MALRSATREVHAAVESRLDLARMAQPRHYARVLQTLHAFHRTWEAALAAALRPGLRDWAQPRSCRAWLDQDLRALGIAPLDSPVPLLRLEGEAAAAGSLYVLEGSALGGQVIARQLGLDPQHGGAYFHGWGAAIGAHWREFCALLEQELAGRADRDRACAGARHTFESLDRWLGTLAA